MLLRMENTRDHRDYLLRNPHHASLRVIIHYSASDVHSSGHRSRLAVCHLGLSGMWNAAENRQTSFSKTAFTQTSVRPSKSSFRLGYMSSLSDVFLSNEGLGHLEMIHGFRINVKACEATLNASAASFTKSCTDHWRASEHQRAQIKISVVHLYSQQQRATHT